MNEHEGEGNQLELWVASGAIGSSNYLYVEPFMFDLCSSPFTLLPLDGPEGPGSRAAVS